MLSEVAQRMGWEPAFNYRKPVEIFREYAALSGFENEEPPSRFFDISALAMLSDAEYSQLEPVQWPLQPGAGSPVGSPRLFDATGRFPTPDGKARFVPTPYRPVAEPPEGNWPLLMNTGRVRDHGHTMTRTGRVPRLMRHTGEPALDIHPADTEQLGLTERGFARVESRHGIVTLRVRLSPTQRRGEVFAAMHWTDRFGSTGPIDRLVGAATDPISGQPELKATAVRVQPAAALWRGMLLRRAELPSPPLGPYYWARIPLSVGHAFEFAGWEPLPSGRAFETWITELLGQPEDIELVIYADPGRGEFRYAGLVGNELDACLFLARPAAPLPSRDDVAALLGSEIIDESRARVLSGHLHLSDGIDNPGGTVCASFAVGLRALHSAITSGGLTSVAEIGAALRAGTNCGSCIPEISAILRDARVTTSTLA
jgi:assimilatory nitrate reductase catalytic subunit